MSHTALVMTRRPVFNPQYSYTLPTAGFVITATFAVEPATPSITVIVPVRAALTVILVDHTGRGDTWVVVAVVI